MPNDSLQTQLKNILNAINDQINQTLDTLYQKKAELEAQIATSEGEAPTSSGSVYVAGEVQGSINTSNIQTGGDFIGRDKTTYHDQ